MMNKGDEKESSSLFKTIKNTKIETDDTSFGYIFTQQSQLLDKVTTSPNIWMFPWVYSAPRLLVSIAHNK